MATPDQIAAFHAGGRKASAKPKQYKPKPQLIEQLCSWEMLGSWVELQIPLIVHAQHGYMRQHYAVASSAKKKQIAAVDLCLQAHLRGVDREAVGGVTFVRVCSQSMDDDNLATAFKHVKDAVAAWIETGGEYDRKKIGIYDGRIDQRTGKAFKWLYGNATHETDKRRQGIRIRLQLTSPQERRPGQ
jgi:hypothetical protein